LVWNSRVESARLERFFLDKVHGCQYDNEKTTSCSDQEVQDLIAQGAKPHDLHRILLAWEEYGVPRPEQEEISPLINERKVDLSYKAFVLRRMEQILKDRKNIERQKKAG
jgi:hypothetical protein